MIKEHSHILADLNDAQKVFQFLKGADNNNDFPNLEAKLHTNDKQKDYQYDEGNELLTKKHEGIEDSKEPEQNKPRKNSSTLPNEIVDLKPRGKRDLKQENIILSSTLQNLEKEYDYTLGYLDEQHKLIIPQSVKNMKTYYHLIRAYQIAQYHHPQEEESAFK